MSSQAWYITDYHPRGLIWNPLGRNPGRGSPAVGTVGGLHSGGCRIVTPRHYLPRTTLSYAPEAHLDDNMTTDRCLSPSLGISVITERRLRVYRTQGTNWVSFAT